MNKGELAAVTTAGKRRRPQIFMKCSGFAGRHAPVSYAMVYRNAVAAQQVTDASGLRKTDFIFDRFGKDYDSEHIRNFQGSENTKFLPAVMAALATSFQQAYSKGDSISLQHGRIDLTTEATYLDGRAPDISLFAKG